MGSLFKSVGKAVKKVAKPEIIIPLALIAATGGAAAPAVGAKGAAAGAGAGGLGGLFSSLFGGAQAAGAGVEGALKGAGLKNILLNQAITAGLSKATTGEIDPKAQLLFVVVLFFKAKEPTATLPSPLVLSSKAIFPIPVLCAPVVAPKEL